MDRGRDEGKTAWEDTPSKGHSLQQCKHWPKTWGFPAMLPKEGFCMCHLSHCFLCELVLYTGVKLDQASSQVTIHF